MKRQVRICMLSLFCMQFFFTSQQELRAQSQCAGISCNNSYLNAGANGNSISGIDYDNIVSTFHSTLARQEDGSVLVWGESIANNGTGNVLTPQELNKTNYPNLNSGATIYLIAGGSNSQVGISEGPQFIVLASDGLYAWGREGVVLHEDITTSTEFRKLTINGQTDGLPNGVSPNQVKMLFATYETLALVTCDGAVYVISQNRYMRGAGHSSSQGSSLQWYRVTTSANQNPNLSGITAVRGAPGGLMATNGTNVWTWGRAVYLGNSASVNSYNRANPMNLTAPADQSQSSKTIVPKMIGMTGTTGVSSHYILGTDGIIYSMGNNDDRQLGDRTTTNRTNWRRVLAGANDNILTNIAWISPNEHDNQGALAVNAITSTGTLWAWGANERNMLGYSSSTSSQNPFSNPGGILATDKIIAVETGGHTSMAIKHCVSNFGYVGHKVNGSMADGVSASNEQTSYNFSGTATLNICGAPSGAATVNMVQAPNYYIGQTYSISVSPLGGTLSVVSGNATVNNAAKTITITGMGAIVVKYSGATGACGDGTLNLGTNVVLPVTFGEVSATISGSQLFVNWSTETETNNSYFEIEASADGTNFQKIGEVVSKAKEGNSSTPLQYQFNIDVSSQIALGLGLLAFGTIGFTLSRRRRLLAMLVVIAGISITIAGCTKETAEPVHTGSKVFVKVTQVDVDGTKTVSKVVQAVSN